MLQALRGPSVVRYISVIYKQPGELWSRRNWAAEPSFARRPDMVETASGTLHGRANIGKFLECCGINLDAR